LERQRGQAGEEVEFVGGKSDDGGSSITSSALYSATIRRAKVYSRGQRKSECGIGAPMEAKHLQKVYHCPSLGRRLEMDCQD